MNPPCGKQFCPRHKDDPLCEVCANDKIELLRAALANAEQCLDLYVEGFGSRQDAMHTLSHVREALSSGKQC